MTFSFRFSSLCRLSVAVLIATTIVPSSFFNKKNGAGTTGIGVIFANAQLNSIETKWDLNFNESEAVLADGDPKRFSLIYYVDTSIVTDNTAGQVFTEDCISAIGDNTTGLEISGGITNIVTRIDDDFDDTNRGRAIFEFDLDMATLVQNENVTQNQPDQSGVMKMCSRFSLQLADGSYEVNFLENIITINFAFDGDFTVDFTVGPKEKTFEEGNQAYTVEAYLCDPRFPDTPLPTNVPIFPGGVLSVCVKPTQEAIDDGLFMRSIDNFKWFRGLTEQPVVEDGLQAGNSLSILVCEPGTMFCTMQSILYAAFFQPTQEPSAFPSEAPSASSSDAPSALHSISPSGQPSQDPCASTNRYQFPASTTWQSFRSSIHNCLSGNCPDNTPMECWDTSEVTTMYKAFNGVSPPALPNIDINSWNTARVSNMWGLAYQSSTFNNDIDDWNVSRVTDCGFMFGMAREFNQPLSSWDVASCTNMYVTFFGAYGRQQFNQDVNMWNVSRVTSFKGTFTGSISFNQPLDNWDISSGTELLGVFKNAPAFNQCLSSWSSKIPYWRVSNKAILMGTACPGIDGAGTQSTYNLYPSGGPWCQGSMHNCTTGSRFLEEEEESHSSSSLLLPSSSSIDEQQQQQQEHTMIDDDDNDEALPPPLQQQRDLQAPLTIQGAGSATLKFPTGRRRRRRLSNDGRVLEDVEDIAQAEIPTVYASLVPIDDENINLQTAGAWNSYRASSILLLFVLVSTTTAAIIVGV